MKKLYLLTEDQLRTLVENRAKELQDETKLELQREIMNKEMHLAGLRGQMNPHFLYNALEGIRGEAILDGVPVIAEIARALADYFRYSLSSRSDVATLSEELSNVKNYIAIQQFRFPDKFHLDIVCDEQDLEQMEAVFPRLSLQPVVENCINHAFVNTRQGANITIRIVRSQKSIMVTVSDNGAGMDQEALDRLNRRVQGFVPQEQEASLEHRRHNGIALPNVARRIRMMYGEMYGMHVSSTPGIGTDVELYVPFCVNWKGENA